MTSKTIILDDRGKAKALSWLNKAPSDRTWKITFSENKTTRSQAQNALSWKWYTMIANYLTENTDREISKNDIHDWLVDLFLPKRFIEFEGRQITKQVGTSELNVSDFSEYLTKVEVWASARRIPLEESEYYEQAMGIK